MSLGKSRLTGFRPDACRAALRESGYVLLHGARASTLVDLLESLGRVLHVEEVVIDATSPSLVKSSRALSLHTDHHRADVIVWFCIAQSDQGGATLLADGVAAYRSLTMPQQEALQRIMLQEHSVFRGDNERHPVVSIRNGSPRLYYSYWLADEAIDDDARDALNAFEAAVRAVPRVDLRLAPGDVLAIDNGRILHGRSEIAGSMQRHLRRYWLEVETL